MRHKDILGEGAKKRKHLAPHDKFITVLKEYKRGTLYSGSGKKVKNFRQALAIGFSEERRTKKRR